MTPPAPLPRETAFDAARRHSRRVRWLKLAVPLLALAGIVGFLGYAFFDPFRVKDVEVDLGKVGVTGDRLTMELPHLTGFNKKQEAYNVTAKTASQRITAPGLIDLTDLDALITMQDKTTATLKAATGRFDSNAEILTLNDRVSVQSTRGYAAQLDSAVINFKAGTVVSDKPVAVTLASGEVKADSLHIVDGGSTIKFNGNVNSVFHTNKKAATAAEPAEQQ